MKGEVVEVSPELAAKWLELNTLNRPLVSHVAERYATSMRLGLWRLTAEPIVFDSMKRLINGQHRLWATFLSGTTQKFYVVREADPDTLLYMDSNFPRNATDNVNLASRAAGGGDVMSRDDGAVLRMLVQGMGRRPVPMPAEVLKEVWPHYSDNILAVHEACSGRTSRPTNTMLRSICARAMFTKSKEKVARFCGVMVSGETRSASERVAILLRDLMLTGWSKGAERPTRIGAYSKIQAALSHFIAGTSPKHLRGVDKELFGIPQPQVILRARAQMQEFENRRVNSSRVRAHQATPATVSPLAYSILDLMRAQRAGMTCKSIAEEARKDMRHTVKLLRQLVAAGYVVKSSGRTPSYSPVPGKTK